ncbi:conserved hypothetical protein [Frankia canadensis]|uniref:Shikimate dehydrogenase n=1 Tax=Frankia canadensis TaxID=1836972 RepID=A0A2I2KQN0_9ACTN|nr:hypothetical protein [Frankia canadensis]SNQ47977.1 conserved hypothetical protein [Frankia canadensis]SOU55267.1 conserved hypothetical protein [Frankia canadensis]
MTTPRWDAAAAGPIWPAGPPAGVDPIRAAVRGCLAAEVGRDLTAAESGGGRLDIGAIGTTAAHAVASPMLARAIADAGLVLGAARHVADPAALAADPGWRLAVVLSPWKQAVAVQLTALSPAAVTTGVVDTVLRGPRGLLGVNTNSWAAQVVLELLAAGREPGRIVLLGAGASARSVALGLRRAWPGTELVISARADAAAQELAAAAGALAVPAAELTGLLDGQAPAILINSTTWGETRESETAPFAFSFDDLLAPGGAFFDLNNRLSDLQARALRAGCTVSSGTLMQRATHACRAALARETLTLEDA